MRQLYVHMHLARWENLKLQSNLPLGLLVHNADSPYDLPLKAPPGSPGCLIAYDSLEALHEAYPGCEYFTMTYTRDD